jgi:hypothetical protein
MAVSDRTTCKEIPSTQKPAEKAHQGRSQRGKRGRLVVIIREIARH